MAYATPGEDSDVYVWSDGDLLHCDHDYDGDEGEYEGSFTTASRSAMVRHLHDHGVSGEKVPKDCYARLLREIAEKGDEVRYVEHTRQPSKPPVD